jgi:ribonuclease-3
MEWSQKNRIEMEFRLVDQTKDVGSPVFQSEVIIEQLIAGSGTGYSKKESQQLAAKQALHRLRKDHTFEADINESKRKRLEAEEAAAKEAEQAAEVAKLAEEEQARIQAEKAEIAAAIAAEEAEAKVEVEAKVELEADADVNPQANA